MRLWRIAQQKYALDKLCTGTALYGGRWNPPGMPALYCGASIAVCALEKFVHVGSGVLPDQMLVAVDLPDDCSVYMPDVDMLPRGWDALPTSLAAQVFGGSWLGAASQLAMKVPSAIVHEEFNMVINPAHPAYGRVLLSEVRPFTFDRRLYK
ncbi:MAG: hypothetical protein JWP59_4027 [Massilia sp.]|nr:hypothetical protein [Massilia sp.]